MFVFTVCVCERLCMGKQEQGVVIVSYSAFFFPPYIFSKFGTAVTK